MNSFTLNNLKIDKKQDQLYNIFTDTVIERPIEKYTTIVQEGEEMRLDKISRRLYGNTQYVEELMVLNNIVNPWSITVNQEINFLSTNGMEAMRKLSPENDDTIETVVNPKKNTRVDPNRNKGVIPTVKPLTLKQVWVDEKANKIKVNTKVS